MSQAVKVEAVEVAPGGPGGGGEPRGGGRGRSSVGGEGEGMVGGEGRRVLRPAAQGRGREREREEEGNPKLLIPCQ
jgi:hypothetical protein